MISQKANCGVGFVCFGGWWNIKMYIRDYYIPEDERIEKMRYSELEEGISIFEIKQQYIVGYIVLVYYILWVTSKKPY